MVRRGGRGLVHWNLQIGDPGPLGLFQIPIYDRGAAALHALRLEVGDEVFFEATRRWLQRYDDAAGTSEDFQAIFEEASGADLDAFFQTWLFDQAKPPGHVDGPVAPHGTPAPR